MRGSGSWVTEATVKGWLVVALVLGAGPAPAARGAAAAESPADLQRSLDKAEKVLRKAESAVRGGDPGHVGLLLRRVEEELKNFEEDSRLEAMNAAIEGARSAARSGDLARAERALLEARGLYPTLSDYAVVRQTEEASREALRAARAGDAALCLQSIERFDGSIRGHDLLARVRQARAAVGRARTMMVRRDMAGGAAEVGAIRDALNGLEYAGALSRALFGLQVGSEFLEQGALIPAKDHVQRALRELRAAVVVGPKAHASALDEAESRVEEVWRRISRPQSGDASKLVEASRMVESLREQLGA